MNPCVWCQGDVCVQNTNANCQPLFIIEGSSGSLTDAERVIACSDESVGWEPTLTEHELCIAALTIIPSCGIVKNDDPQAERAQCISSYGATYDSECAWCETEPCLSVGNSNFPYFCYSKAFLEDARAGTTNTSIDWAAVAEDDTTIACTEKAE
eukprot:UN24222